MSNTGWPGPEFPENDVAYVQHANVKLSAEQKEYITNSGESESQWIREAIQDRMDKEAHYQRAQEADRNLLRGRLNAKMRALAGESDEHTT